MTFKQVYKKGVSLLRSSGIECFLSDSLWIYEECFNMGRKELIIKGDEAAPQNETARFFNMVQMRLDGVPVQYIVGHCNFMCVDLMVGPGVLIPRDDTEVLARKAIEVLKKQCYFSSKALNVVDLCSGTGAIALSIKKILGSKVNVFAIELYDSALKYLKNNTLRNNLNVNIIKGDVFTCHKNFKNGQIDCIISNPPYIPTKDLKNLSSDVKQEPSFALDGGADGLDFYRSISENWLDKLLNKGIICLEIGINQKEYICKIFNQKGINKIQIYKDINGIERVIIGKK